MIKTKKYFLEDYANIKNDDWGIPLNLGTWLKDNNFKLLGSGYFSDAYASPNEKFVVKVNRGFEMDENYINFIEYCQKNSNNPHLPRMGKLKKYENWYIVFIELLPGKISTHDLGFSNASMMKDFFIEAERRNIVYNEKTLMKLFNDIMNEYNYNEFDEFAEKFNISYESYIENTEYGNQLLGLTNTLCDFCKSYGITGKKIDLHHKNIMKDSKGILKIIDPVI